MNAQHLPQWRRAVATIIKATRQDNDVTQPELARRTGWSRDKVAKMESGSRRIEFGEIVAIATALKERPDTLIRRILAW